MKKLLSLIVAAAAVGFMSGCVDDNYDLSDIDTTTQLTVNELTLPVNIDAITMKSIIDTLDSDIKIIDGVFAVSKDGTVTSSEIKIDPIHMAKPVLSPSSKNLDASGAPALISAGMPASLPLPGAAPVPFTYEKADVTTDVVEIDEIGCVFTIDITLDFNGLESVVKSLSFDNLVFQLPKGLTSEDSRYDSDTGLLNIGTTSTTGSSLLVEFLATRVDKRSGFTFSGQHLKFTDDLSIHSGNVVITSADLKGSASSIPSNVRLVTTFDLSEIDVKTVTGVIQHAIEEFDVPEVDLSSLPKALQGDESNIVLDDPQVYLTLNNPSKGVAHGLMSIVPWREDVASPACVANEDIVMAPLSNRNYCLVPAKDFSAFLPEYKNSIVVWYESLGKILSGAGIPTKLQIEILNAGLPAQYVTDFEIGVDLGKVEGTYLFYAPLRFDPSTRIVYSETIDGWYSEDMEDLTIKQLHVKALVSTDSPLAFDLTGYPIDQDKNIINGVKFEKVTVPANAKDYPIDIVLQDNGNDKISITGLDGIEFRAYVQPDSNTPIEEKQSIVLTNIKATASGVFVKEL